jgi:hypothetical protein
MVFVPEGRSPGRVRLRPNRGSRLASSDNVTPNSRSDDLIIPCRANKILKFSRHAISVLRRWPRMSWSLERLIKGGDVTGECDARSPGSGGASPYLEFT